MVHASARFRRNIQDTVKKRDQAHTTAREDASKQKGAGRRTAAPSKREETAPAEKANKCASTNMSNTDFCHAICLPSGGLIPAPVVKRTIRRAMANFHATGQGICHCCSKLVITPGLPWNSLAAASGRPSGYFAMHSVVPWNRFGTALRRLSGDFAMHAGLPRNRISVRKCRRELGNG